MMATGLDDVGGAEATRLPVLRREALPGLIGEIVDSATKNSEADPAAVLATLLAAVGAQAGRGPYVDVSDHHHYACSFSVLVGQSSRARKGTSEAPIHRIMKEVWRRISPFKWKPGPMSSGEGLIYAIRDGDGADDPGEVDKRLLIVEGEFAGPLKAMQRQGNTLSTILRSAYDGKDLDPLTKNSKISASSPHICILGHITEQELRLLLAHVDIFNGFANRFLWWCVRRRQLIPLAPGMRDEDVIRLAAELAERLLAAKKLSAVTFTEDAREVYGELYPLLTADQDGLLGAITSRAEVHVIRLALLYAIAAGEPTITCDHVQAAVAVWDFCNESAGVLFGDVIPDPLEERVGELLQRGPKSLTALHDGLGRHTKSNVLREDLKRMIVAGVVVSQEEPTGGRPSTIYRLCDKGEVAKEANKAKKGFAPRDTSLNSLNLHGVGGEGPA